PSHCTRPAVRALHGSGPGPIVPGLPGRSQAYRRWSRANTMDSELARVATTLSFVTSVLLTPLSAIRFSCPEPVAEPVPEHALLPESALTERMRSADNHRRCGVPG